MSWCRIGTVVATYPSGNSVDVQMDDGTPLNMQVLCGFGGSDFGCVDMPSIGLADDDSRWSFKSKPPRKVRAVVAMLDGVPVCIGFLLPQENEISFDRKNFRIARHASDVYTSIDENANIELAHPSGTFLRIATSAAHEDLTGADVDKLWNIDTNTDKLVNVQLTVANGGNVKASINIDPDGNIAIEHAGNLSVTTAGDAAVNVDGNAAVTVGGDLNADVTGSAELNASELTINAPTTINGALQVNSTIDATGEIKSGAIGLTSHKHGGVQTGGGTSGPSVP